MSNNNDSVSYLQLVEDQAVLVLVDVCDEPTEEQLLLLAEAAIKADGTSAVLTPERLLKNTALRALLVEQWQAQQSQEKAKADAAAREAREELERVAKLATDALLKKLEGQRKIPAAELAALINAPYHQPVAVSTVATQSAKPTLPEAVKALRRQHRDNAIVSELGWALESGKTALALRKILCGEYNRRITTLLMANQDNDAVRQQLAGQRRQLISCMEIVTEVVRAWGLNPKSDYADDADVAEVSRRLAGTKVNQLVELEPVATTVTPVLSAAEKKAAKKAKQRANQLARATADDSARPAPNNGKGNPQGQSGKK